MKGAAHSVTTIEAKRSRRMLETVVAERVRMANKAAAKQRCARDAVRMSCLTQNSASAWRRRFSSFLRRSSSKLQRST